MNDIFQIAEKALYCNDIEQKINLVNTLDASMAISTGIIKEVSKPGRPTKPELVSPKLLSRRRTGSKEGLAALLHSIAHIEFNAINLALDALYRFPNLPTEYYKDWIKVAKEESYHFSMLSKRLVELGYQYGDFPAHNGLWEMAVKTAHSPLVRMALVPRLMEARGLDVSPLIIKKLEAVNDSESVKIMEIILRDEVGHVQIGNRWYRYLCEQAQLEPMDTFFNLLKEFAPTYLRKPFARALRESAGFTVDELDSLERSLA